MGLFYYKNNEEDNVVEAIDIKCSNCDIIAVLFLKVKTVKEIITKFVLNIVLYHVGLSWIIYANKQMKYDIKENNHPDWLNKGPPNNTAICSKFHGTVFGGFIRNFRTNRCNIMCQITANNKLQPTYVDDESSIGGISIPNNAITAALESLGAILNYIYFWLKLFQDNYEVRSKIYHEAMKILFKQIPTNKSKPLIQGKKYQLLLTDIRGSWYLTHLAA